MTLSRSAAFRDTLSMLGALLPNLTLILELGYALVLHRKYNPTRVDKGDS